MAKRVNTRRIRANRSYDVTEAASVCGVTVWTVRNWIKQGLPRLDGQRPTLISGEALKSFLQERRAQAKCRLKSGEMYCPSCRAASIALGGEVEVKHYGNRRAVQGICPRCDGICSRFVSQAQLKDFEALAALPMPSLETPKGTPKLLPNSNLQRGRS